ARRGGSARRLPARGHARELHPPALRELPGISRPPARGGGVRAPVAGARASVSLRGRLAVLMLVAACAAPAPTPAGPPARVVSLAPSVTETLSALGAGDRLAGVCAQCDRPPAALGLPRVGGYLAPSVEAVLGLRPALVIVVPSPGNREAVRAIERAGVRVLVVQDRTLADLRASIRDVSSALGIAAAGGGLVGDLDHRLAEGSRPVRAPPRPRVLAIVGHRPLVAVGRGTLQAERNAIAGGDNGMAE